MRQYHRNTTGNNPCRRAGNAVTMMIGVTVLALMCLVSTAEAIVFTPNPVDVGDLVHQKYYAWEINKGIDWSIPAGQTIESITLTIDDITDWRDENDDLWIHLMDGIPSGGTPVIAGGNVFWWSDGQGGGDNWGAWPLIAHYTDTTDPWDMTEDLTYTFSPALVSTFTDYVSNDINNIVYVGFDPDCHYWNNGVQLDVTTTSAVPEPSTLLLLGGGLLGLAGLARKRRS